MTVAAFIGAGETPALGLGKTQGAAHGAVRSGVAASGLLSSTVSAAESFRANWQSLLASLGSSMEGSGEAEADQEATSTESASEQTFGNTSVSTSLLAAGISLRLGAKAEKGSIETDTETILSLPVAQTQTVVAEPAAGAAKPVSTTVEKNNLATEPDTESARSSRPARSTNATEADTVPVEALSGLVPAAIANLAQAVPATAVVSQVAQSTNEPAPLAKTDISAALSTNQPVTSVSASSSPQMSVMNASGKIAGAVNADVQQTAEAAETSAKPTLSSPVSTLSGSSGSTLSETESTVADKDAPLTVVMLVGGGNTTETPAPARSLTQQTTQTAAQDTSPVETRTLTLVSSSAFVSDQNRVQTSVPSQSLTQASVPTMKPAEVLATSQASSPALAPEQRRTQASVSSQAAEQNQSSAETQATSQATPPIFVSSRSQTHSLAPGSNPIQVSAPSLNPMQTQVANQSCAQTIEPISNQTETLSASQSSSQALVSNQYRTPALVQGQEQVATLPGNQNVNVIGAPVTGDSLNPIPAAATAQSGQLAAQPSTIDKSVSIAAGKTLTHESIHGVGSSDSVQLVKPLIEGQSSGPVLDASTMARASASVGGAVNTVNEPSGASSVAATQPDSRETFATLDATGATAATTWIHAGTQRAEAGYQDPALGWVGVRADMSGGGVHAQLVPGSTDAAQALGSHLAGLNTYLAEHHTPVETLTLTAPEGGWSGLSGQGAGEGMQQEAGQQTAQSTDASIPSGSNPESVSPSPSASLGLPAFFGDMDIGPHSASLDGLHISVMA
ncbi:MAG: hypothetical protein ABSB30_01780 [Terracidiphilus sp.]